MKNLTDFRKTLETGLGPRLYSVKICREKQQKLAELWRKMYFKNELKYSKRSDHVTDNVMSLFW